MEVHLDYSPKSNGPTSVPSSSGPVPVEMYLDYSSKAGGSQKISNVICNGLCNSRRAIVLFHRARFANVSVCYLSHVFAVYFTTEP